MATKPVTVGVDGSEESLRAVEWAALEARRHCTSLRIVSAPAKLPRLCAEVSPVPEITFAGPVDDALAAEASDQVLGMLRAALGLLGTPAGPTLICVEAAESLSVIVTGTGTPRQAANGDGRTRDLTPQREQARRDGIVIEIESAADETRLAWNLPLRLRALRPAGERGKAGKVRANGSRRAS